MFMFKKDKNEIKKSLDDTIIKNNNALDYIQNKISKVQNLVDYNPDDVISIDELNNLKYIEFTLKYLDKSYKDSLRSL